MELIFEWNDNKARLNRKNHQISFEEAKTIFNDPFLVTFPDEFHSNTEERLMSIGASATSRVLLVVHTDARKPTMPSSSVSSAPAKPRQRNAKFMKKTKRNKIKADEMLPEYDFTGKTGVRGKYYQAYQQGHTVRVHKADGSTTVQYFTLQEGAVLLEPDVKPYFPNSATVNQALRSLIALIPQKRPKRKATS